MRSWFGHFASREWHSVGVGSTRSLGQRRAEAAACSSVHFPPRNRSWIRDFRTEGEEISPTALLLDRELIPLSGCGRSAACTPGPHRPPGSSLRPSLASRHSSSEQPSHRCAIPVPPRPCRHPPRPPLTDPRLSPDGILQSSLTHPSRLTGTGPNTLERAVAALVRAEWPGLVAFLACARLGKAYGYDVRHRVGSAVGATASHGGRDAVQAVAGARSCGK